MSEPIHILLVEDDLAWEKYFREAVAQSLDNTFRFSFAGDLKTAMEKLAEDKSIQLVMLDLMLPDSEALNTLKVMAEKTKFLPIIVLSTLADEKIIHMAMQFGMQDYLVKDEYDDKLFLHVAKAAIRRELHKVSKMALDELEEVRQRLQRVFDTLASLDPV